MVSPFLVALRSSLPAAEPSDRWRIHITATALGGIAVEQKLALRIDKTNDTICCRSTACLWHDPVG
jgi:hypothetical protein